VLISLRQGAATRPRGRERVPARDRDHAQRGGAERQRDPGQAGRAGPAEDQAAGQ
jgi:hypothetical protein